MVFVKLAGTVGGGGLGAHVEGDHELCELSAIYEPDVFVSGGDCLGGAPGCVGEVGRRDKQAHVGSVWLEAAGEVAYFRLFDGLRPAFGLDVDPVNAEGVPIDDAVNAAVSAGSEVVAPSVADAFEEVQDGLLEAVGLEVYEGVEDVVGLSEL